MNLGLQYKYCCNYFKVSTLRDEITPPKSKEVTFLVTTALEL